MEIDHIVSIVDLDEHGNPRFTCSVKPDYRDHWSYETNDDKLQRALVRTSDRTETNGDILKDSDHTEYYNTLREVLSEEQINALTEDCLRLLGKKIF